VSNYDGCEVFMTVMSPNMKRKKGPVTYAILIVLVIFSILFWFTAFQYLYRGSRDDIHTANKEIMAHRGVHQNYNAENIDWLTGNEAVRIYPPKHTFIENTFESIDEAIENGATILEIDIRMTGDGNLVIMHDGILEHKTNGTGKVCERTVAYIKELDLGYGYTADSGKTYPLRGTGIGKAITFDELLQLFPDQSFMIDHKDGNDKSTVILMKKLSSCSAEQRKKLFYWGRPGQFMKIHDAYPEIRRFFLSRAEVKRSFLPFFLSFGLLKMPAECENLTMVIPARYVKFLWGWPYRFIQCLHDNKIRLFLYVDTVEDANKYKGVPVDGFVTDYIEDVGLILSEQ
jgi:glycerophosphoryl diester phosphodiesterase